MKKITFMLDMDGVCCDWISGALKTIGKEELIGTWTPGIKSLEDYTNICNEDMWELLDAEGSRWWRNLEEFPWFQEMYSYLKNYGDVIFCTSPGWDANSTKGKLHWLQDRFGRDFRNYIFTNKKFYVANSNTVLIDDNDKQCHNFVEYGGKAILFPQLWNETAVDIAAQKDKLRHIQKEVEKILKNK